VIKVRLKFFSILIDIVGRQELVLTFHKDNITVKDVIEYVEKNYPKLVELKRHIPITILINGTNASKEDIINDGDEIAFLPPASGG